MPNEIVKENFKVISACPVCNHARLYYYYGMSVSNIDVICPACKRFLMVINEYEDSKNIHLHIYKSQSIVKGIIRAHATDFKDW